MNKRYYYKVSIDSSLGRQLHLFHQSIIRAEQARQAYLSHIGAEGFQDDESVMVGRVQAVSFADDKKVDERQWRRLHKDADGVQMWESNVEHRTGYIILPRRSFKPSDTANRVYRRGVYCWTQVSPQYTLKEWAAMAGIRLTGDKKRDAERISGEMQDALLAGYTEVYVKDFDPQATNYDTRIKQPWWVKQAVANEVQRMKLPTISQETLYRILQADSPLPEGKTIGTVNEYVPNFFKLGNKYYLAVSRKCQHEQLEEITAEQYSSKCHALTIA